MITPPNEDCLEIAGARGTGKSSLVKALCITKDVRRRIFLDCLQDYKEGEQVELVTSDPKELKKYLERAQSDSPFSVAFVPGELDEQSAGIYCAELAWRLKNCTYIMEEAHLVADQWTCPDILIRIVKTGRHRGVNIWTVSQRPSDINSNLRAELEAQELWLLRLRYHRDIVWCKQLHPELGNVIKKLPNMHTWRIPGNPGDDPTLFAEEFEIYYPGKFPRLSRTGEVIHA